VKKAAATTAERLAKFKNTLSSSAARSILLANIANGRVDAGAITSKANSGHAPSVTESFIRASIGSAYRRGKMRQPAQWRFTPDQWQIA
jgi:hypothetical protein